MTRRSETSKKKTTRSQKNEVVQTAEAPSLLGRLAAIEGVDRIIEKHLAPSIPWDVLSSAPRPLYLRRAEAESAISQVLLADTDIPEEHWSLPAIEPLLPEGHQYFIQAALMGLAENGLKKSAYFLGNDPRNARLYGEMLGIKARYTGLTVREFDSEELLLNPALHGASHADKMRHLSPLFSTDVVILKDFDFSMTRKKNNLFRFLRNLKWSRAPRFIVTARMSFHEWMNAYDYFAPTRYSAAVGDSYFLLHVDEDYSSGFYSSAGTLMPIVEEFYDFRPSNWECSSDGSYEKEYLWRDESEYDGYLSRSLLRHVSY